MQAIKTFYLTFSKVVLKGWFFVAQQYTCPGWWQCHQEHTTLGAYLWASLPQPWDRSGSSGSRAGDVANKKLMPHTAHLSTASPSLLPAWKLALSSSCTPLHERRMEKACFQQHLLPVMVSGENSGSKCFWQSFLQPLEEEVVAVLDNPSAVH